MIHHGQNPKHLLLVNIDKKDLIGKLYSVVDSFGQVGLVVKTLSKPCRLMLSLVRLLWTMTSIQPRIPRSYSNVYGDRHARDVLKCGSYQ